MMTGTYIGGSINLATVSTAFDVSGEVLAAATVADNLACYFFVLIAIHGNALFRKWYKHPYVDEVEANKDSSSGVSSNYWKKNPFLSKISPQIWQSAPLLWQFRGKFLISCPFWRLVMM